jgi:hypothetical protein
VYGWDFAGADMAGGTNTPRFIPREEDDNHIDNLSQMMNMFPVAAHAHFT